MRAETVIATHGNTDFDAFVAMLAARRLYPGAVVAVGPLNRNVRDFYRLHAEELAPITVKGVSKPVRTHRVLDIHDEAAGAAQAIRHQRPGARIEVDPRRLSEDDRIATLEGDLGTAKTTVGTLQTEAEASQAELDELRAMREADQKRLEAYEQLQARFKSLVDAGDLEVAFRKGQMTLKLPSGVLFASADAALSEKGQKTLAKVTKLLLEIKDRRFLVAGHTDNVPIKTELFANNWYLSSARAVTVVEYMIAQGFPASQLAAAAIAAAFATLGTFNWA